MPKKDDDDKPRSARPVRGERPPPPLSEKLIAQLQGAVDAAQRKRGARPRQTPDPAPGQEGAPPKEE
jgi:hypothetical protein